MSWLTDAGVKAIIDCSNIKGNLTANEVAELVEQVSGYKHYPSDLMVRLRGRKDVNVEILGCARDLRPNWKGQHQVKVYRVTYQR